MARPEADPWSRHAVPGSIPAVAQLSESHRDSGNAAEDAFHRLGAVGAGRGRGGVQAEGLLSLTNQLRQISLLVYREATLSQDDLGGALDQLLRATDSECRIVSDRALHAVELFPDRARILQANKRALSELRPAETMWPVSASVT